MNEERYFGNPFTNRLWEGRRTSVERAYLEMGRPQRQTIINEDDITNLKIALGIARSVDEFVRMI